MPVIPLKVIKGSWLIPQANLSKNASGANAILGGPTVIAPSELSIGSTDAESGDPYNFSISFTWTGEVGDPKGMFNDAMPNGSGIASDYLKDPNAKVKTLRDGDYFMLAVVYRKYWQDAFARNQFKILYPDKQLLEKGTWYSSAWSPSFLKSCQGATSPPANTPMIPDELIPFHFDSTSPNLQAQ